MNPLMAKELNQVSLDVSQDESVRSVVLTSTGRMFCAGGDLSEFASAKEGAGRLMMEMAADLHLGLSRLSRNRAPVIAAVNGTAAGAGFSLVMACDLVIASEGSVYYYGLYECRFVARWLFHLFYASPNWRSEDQRTHVDEQGAFG